MANKYGNFGKYKPEDEKRKPIEANPIVDFTDPSSAMHEAGQQVSDGQQTKTSAPNSGSPLTQLKPLPKLYEGEGKDRKINPNYDTSILKDMAVGAGLLEPTGNPYNDLGQALGGFIGGAFNKNLAGKEQYKKDVARIQMENKDTLLRTEAYQRAEQQKLQIQREDRIKKGQDEKNAIALSKSEVKNKGDMSKFLIQAAGAATTPEARIELSNDFNKLWDIEAPADPNFGQKYKETKVGDYQMLFDAKTGEFINAKDKDGENLSALDTEKQLKILKAWTGLAEKDTPDLKSALEQADEYIGKNFKGGLKAQQYNSLKMQLAREIVKMQKDGGSGKVIVNGTVIPLPNLDILNQKPPLAEQPSGSQFMPPIDTIDGGTTVIDATTGKDITPQAKNVLPAYEENQKTFKKFQDGIPNLPKPKQDALNNLLADIKEGEEVKIKQTIDGIKRTIILTKRNGQLGVIGIQ